MNADSKTKTNLFDIIRIVIIKRVVQNIELKQR